MKNLIYIFVLCSSYIGGYSQDFPTIYTTEACSYTGSIEITFQHDMTSYPLPYNASYYNETEGDYEDIVITSSFFTIDGVNAGEYEIEVWLDDETIMEFCADVEKFTIKDQLNLTVQNADCYQGNGRIIFSPTGFLVSLGSPISSALYDEGLNLIEEIEFEFELVKYEELMAQNYLLIVDLPNTENVNPPVTTDKNNLMISGERTSGDINSSIIRHYLWEIMRERL